MPEFNATLYGDKLPVAGEKVAAFFAGDKLVIKRGNPPDLHIPTAQITASVGGFEHDELFLNWQFPVNENGQINGTSEICQKYCTLKSASHADSAIVLAQAPAALANQLMVWQRRRRHIKLVWRSIGATLVAMVISVILIWWQYDRILGYVAAKIPISTEQKIGQAGLAQLKTRDAIIENNAAAEAVRKIGSRLTQGSRYKYQWVIARNSTVNAFAMPGGVVIVNSALIEKIDSADELAAVLAHEVQHVEQRHTLKSMLNSLGWAAILTVALGDVGALATVIAHQAGTMYYGRDLEVQADKLGFAALIHAKIKPEGFVSFLQKLKRIDGSEVPSWLSSHPATDERIQILQQLVNTMPCADCTSLDINWESVQTSLKKSSSAPNHDKTKL